MATSYVLKRKKYSTAILDAKSGNILNGANSSLPTAQTSAFNSLPENFSNLSAGKQSSTMKAAVGNSGAQRIGSIEGVRRINGTTNYRGNVTSAGAYKLGQQNTGILQGAKNTWNNMGTAGKVGTIAAAGTAAALIGKGLLSKKKKEDK